MNLEKIKQSPMYIGTMTSKALPFIRHSKVGEVVYLSDTDSVRIYDGKEWAIIGDSANDTIDTGLSLLELNRSAIGRLKSHSARHFKNRIEELNSYVDDSDNDYYMLYGKELGYFTVFSIGNENSDFENFGEAVLECLRNLGEVYSIDKKDDDPLNLSYEIWIAPTGTSKPTVLYLFPYDSGIVKVG